MFLHPSAPSAGPPHRPGPVPVHQSAVAGERGPGEVSRDGPIARGEVVVVDPCAQTLHPRAEDAPVDVPPVPLGEPLSPLAQKETPVAVSLTLLP